MVHFRQLMLVTYRVYNINIRIFKLTPKFIEGTEIEKLTYIMLILTIQIQN